LKAKSKNNSIVSQQSAIVQNLCSKDETIRFESKRVSGKMVHKALETVVAFANTEGGFLVLGLEDFKKAKGVDRLFGIQENPEAVDELRRKVEHSIIPRLDEVIWRSIPCVLRDGSEGSLVVVEVMKSAKVHSVVEDGTWKRLEHGISEMTAREVNELCFARGVISAETETVPAPFELLDNEYWKTYCQTRKLTTGDIGDRMFRIGLARKKDGTLQPTRAAVLLFAEDPSGIMACKAAIRIFHYTGIRIEHGPVPNLIKTPKTISGPLIRQIEYAYDFVINEIVGGLKLAASGFETVHLYPTRVIKEAITNAVIHRDYHINRDIHIRIFDNRIEVESPGLFPGTIRPENLETAGSLSRNALIVNHLREFPIPPNIDAGEGVRMMFSTMRAVGLYPPMYSTRPFLKQDGVMVVLLNEERPPIWEQVSDWLDRNRFITNADLCKIANIDTLAASRLFSKWVIKDMLISDKSKGKRGTRYYKPGQAVEQLSLFLLSDLEDNKQDEWGNG
jgi:ATP-dependent DNA helicase RecG